MVNLSKVPINEEVRKKIREQFLQLLSSVRTKRESAEIFDELFTEAERVMFAKRLAIIAMIARGHSIYEVSHSLKVSTSTASYFENAYFDNELPTLKKLFSKQTGQKTADVDALIEFILYLGMPPFDANGRRKWITKMRDGESR